MTIDDLYACSRCGAFFASEVDFERLHEKEGHEEVVKLRTLSAGELVGTDKVFALFELERPTLHGPSKM